MEGHGIVPAEDAPPQRAVGSDVANLLSFFNAVQEPQQTDVSFHLESTSQTFITRTGNTAAAAKSDARLKRGSGSPQNTAFSVAKTAGTGPSLKMKTTVPHATTPPSTAAAPTSSASPTAACICNNRENIARMFAVHPSIKPSNSDAACSVPLGVDFKIFSTVGDGNCLFRAISRFLFGSENFHPNVRKSVVSFIVSNSSYFNSFVEKPWPTYIKQMSRCDGAVESRGGTTEILAISTMLQCPVYCYCMYSSEMKWTHFLPLFKTTEYPLLPYVSIHHLRDHYSVIMPASSSCICNSTRPIVKQQKPIWVDIEDGPATLVHGQVLPASEVGPTTDADGKARSKVAIGTQSRANLTEATAFPRDTQSQDMPEKGAASFPDTDEKAMPPPKVAPVLRPVLQHDSPWTQQVPSEVLQRAISPLPHGTPHQSPLNSSRKVPKFSISLLHKKQVTDESGTVASTSSLGTSNLPQVTLDSPIQPPNSTVPKFSISLLQKKQVTDASGTVASTSSLGTSNLPQLTPDSPIQPPNSTVLTGMPSRARIQKPEHTGARCCVFGCSNRRGIDKKNNIKRSYHLLPTDPDRRELWLNAIPRDWSPGKYDTICGDHFVGGKPSGVKGSEAYVPTIFPTKPIATQRKTATSKRAGTDMLCAPNKRRRLPRSPERPGWETIDHDYIRTRPCQDTAAPQSDNKAQTTSSMLPCACGQTDSADNQPRTKDNVQHPDSTLKRDQYVAQLLQRIHELEEREKEFEEREKEFEERMKAFEDRKKGKELSVDLIRRNDEDCLFYTGMPNYATFKALSDYLYEGSKGQLRYWHGKDTAAHEHYSLRYASKPGRKRTFTFEEEFFITLVRLKTGKFLKDIAREMETSTSVLSRIVTTWMTFLAVELKELFEMKVNLEDEDMIAPCYHSFRSLKIVIDCTELVAERSSNLDVRKQTYSNYKSNDTFKFMVGLSPNMTVSYVSSGHGGRASDKHITLDSASLLDNLPPGSQVMADRGFRVSEELRSLGVHLIIPDFKGLDRSQMTQQEVCHSEEIARARIHIERVIQRIRNYHILDSTVKLSQKDVVVQTFTVCAYLVNFQTPIKRLRVAPTIDTPVKGPLDYLEPLD